MQTWTPFNQRLQQSCSQQNSGYRLPLKTLQINIGKLCNLACLHCHVEAGPHKKRENMTKATLDRLIELAAKTPSLEVVDITGGAPELNPYFRHAVTELRKLGLEVIDRCNLTVLFEQGQEDTHEFLADHQVTVVASLPCYAKENVEKQRGDGVFDLSIRGLQRLNQVGYGREPHLRLDLVYNPVGPYLPPAQASLEADYRERLESDFGICFGSLYTITNMPIKRFLFDLKRSKQYDNYMKLLEDNFNPQSIEGLMCRSMLSISWDGRIFDCDFNQMLDMELQGDYKDIWQIDQLEQVRDVGVRFANHCYGCTAGAGSSCGGALT